MKLTDLDEISKGAKDPELLYGYEKLNENYYIVPGLGDMGDRLFGTV